MPLTVSLLRAGSVSHAFEVSGRQRQVATTPVSFAVESNQNKMNCDKLNFKQQYKALATCMLDYKNATMPTQRASFVRFFLALAEKLKATS